MSKGVVKIDDLTYEIDGIRIHKYDKMWCHAMDSIGAVKNKSTPAVFRKKMITRMLRLKNKTKLLYSIAYLKDIGEDYLADMHDAKLIADKLMNM